MLAVSFAILCLVSVSQSAPLNCEDLIRPLDQVDLHTFDGRWALVAGSMDDPRVVRLLLFRDSTTIYGYNSSFIQVDRYRDVCEETYLNVTVESSMFNISVSSYIFSGMFIHTSCPDCVVFSFNVETPAYGRRDLYLFSKRRELSRAEMLEFRAQVLCMNLPPPFVPDPAKELCPRKTEIKPEAHGKEKVEEKKP